MSKSNEEIREIIRQELRALIEEGQEQESAAVTKAKETAAVVGKGTGDILGTTTKAVSEIVSSVGSLLDGISKLF